MTPAPSQSANKAGCGILEIYLAVTLPGAFDSSGSLKEKKETEFLLIVRKSQRNFSLGDYITDTWDYVFHPGCPKNEATEVFSSMKSPSLATSRKATELPNPSLGSRGTLEDHHHMHLQWCDCTSILEEEDFQSPIHSRTLVPPSLSFWGSSVANRIMNFKAR